MRLVLDTNVLVSALLWPGTPTRLIELASEGEIQLYTSRVLVDELRDVLHRPKLTKAILATGLSAEELTRHYQRLAYLVTARQLTQPVCRDADDDHVLACALAARAELIVTGDTDLLVLHPFRGIPILNAQKALHWLLTE